MNKKLEVGQQQPAAALLLLLLQLLQLLGLLQTC
jgi:hypothetical protein